MSEQDNATEGGEGWHRMDRETFARHLAHASEAALVFARRYVSNELPAGLRYRVGSYSVTLSPEASVELLYGSGDVPVWIDINVDSADDRETVLGIRYSTRRTRRDEMLRYRDLGYPPFQCLSPRLPPGWRAESSREPFDLNWHRSQRMAQPL